MKDEMFYWFDDGDNITVGPFTMTIQAMVAFERRDETGKWKTVH